MYNKSPAALYLTQGRIDQMHQDVSVICKIHFEHMVVDLCDRLYKFRLQLVDQIAVMLFQLLLLCLQLLFHLAHFGKASLVAVVVAVLFRPVKGLSPEILCLLLRCILDLLRLELCILQDLLRLRLDFFQIRSFHGSSLDDRSISAVLSAILRFYCSGLKTGGKLSILAFRSSSSLLLSLLRLKLLDPLRHALVAVYHTFIVLCHCHAVGLVYIPRQ